MSLSPVVRLPGAQRSVNPLGVTTLAQRGGRSTEQVVACRVVKVSVGGDGDDAVKPFTFGRAVRARW